MGDFGLDFIGPLFATTRLRGTNMNKKLSFNKFFQFSLSSLVLLSLGACGDKTEDTAETLKSGTFIVARHGCEGNLVSPEEQGISLQMKFTDDEMITMRTDSNGLNNNNESNDYYENTSNNNFDYGYYDSVETERELIRYVDESSFEVVNRDTTEVDRFNIEFKNDDRNMILSTQATGEEVNCSSGKSYIIELYRQE